MNANNPVTPAPVTWSETPPSEDGQFHLSRLHQPGHSEPLIGQKTGNWWLILGWNCDEYCSEDLVQMGITFGPRITLTPAPPALEWVDLETALGWPRDTPFVYRWRYFPGDKWQHSTSEIFNKNHVLSRENEIEHQFLRLDGGQA